MKLWRFHCEADRLPDGNYRVVITSDSGKRLERVGFHPLWELIRLLGPDLTDQKEQR